MCLIWKWNFVSLFFFFFMFYGNWFSLTNPLMITFRPNEKICTQPQLWSVRVSLSPKTFLLTHAHFDITSRLNILSILKGEKLKLFTTFSFTIFLVLFFFPDFFFSSFLSPYVFFFLTDSLYSKTIHFLISLLCILTNFVSLFTLSWLCSISLSLSVLCSLFFFTFFFLWLFFPCRFLISCILMIL